jgi:hypothetical protein
MLPIAYQLLEQPEKTYEAIRWRDMRRESFGVGPLECILCGNELLLSRLVFGKKHLNSTLTMNS